MVEFRAERPCSCRSCSASSRWPGAPLAAPAKGGGALQPRLVLDGYGRLQAPPAGCSRWPRAQGASTRPATARHPPGYYGDGVRQVALNLGATLPRLAPLGDLPAGSSDMSMAKAAA